MSPLDRAGEVLAIDPNTHPPGGEGWLKVNLRQSERHRKKHSLHSTAKACECHRDYSSSLNGSLRKNKTDVKTLKLVRVSIIPEYGIIEHQE